MPKYRISDEDMPLVVCSHCFNEIVGEPTISLGHPICRECINAEVEQQDAEYWQVMQDFKDMIKGQNTFNTNLYVVEAACQGVDSEAYYFWADRNDLTNHLTFKGAVDKINELLDGGINLESFASGAHGYESEMVNKYTIRIKELLP